MTEQVDLDALELRAMRFQKLNPLHECFDSATVLALIAELRQERERAGFYQLELHTSDDTARLRLQRAHKAEAALSRAEEAIKNELAKHVEREWRPLDGTYLGGTICKHCRRDYPCSTVQILTEYYKQNSEGNET